MTRIWNVLQTIFDQKLFSFIHIKRLEMVFGWAWNWIASSSSIGGLIFFYLFDFDKQQGNKSANQMNLNL